MIILTWQGRKLRLRVGGPGPLSPHSGWEVEPNAKHASDPKSAAPHYPEAVPVFP